MLLPVTLQIFLPLAMLIVHLAGRPFLSFSKKSEGDSVKIEDMHPV